MAIDDQRQPWPALTNLRAGEAGERRKVGWYGHWRGDATLRVTSASRRRRGGEREGPTCPMHGALQDGSTASRQPP